MLRRVHHPEDLGIFKILLGTLMKIVPVKAGVHGLQGSFPCLSKSPGTMQLCDKIIFRCSLKWHQFILLSVKLKNLPWIFLVEQFPILASCSILCCGTIYCKICTLPESRQGYCLLHRSVKFDFQLALCIEPCDITTSPCLTACASTWLISNHISPWHRMLKWDSIEF